jgi:hypothetical protein
LFGTYENPKHFRASCGFDDAREQQLVAMLAYRDVHADAPRRSFKRRGLRYLFVPSAASQRDLR